MQSRIRGSRELMAPLGLLFVTLLVAAIGLTVTIGSSGISPRSYNGGGLYKMEPKELANVPAKAIAAMLPHVEDRPAAQGELFATRTGVAAR